MPETIPDRKRIAIQAQATSEPLFEVYHLSHDLRGPLNSILGFTELLLEEVEGPLTDIQKEDITAINQSAQNLLHLINTIVDLSKLDAGRLDFSFEEVPLDRVISQVLAADSWVTQTGGIEVVVNLPTALPLLWGDRSRIEQMTAELLGMAARLKETRKIVITANGNSEMVTIQIDCVGGMIPAQALAEMFKLIVKTDATGRSHLGAGGLELPLVQRIVDKHEGQVWSESTDRGTRFYVSLPTVEAKRPAWVDG